jgi:hypothetical protein
MKNTYSRVSVRCIVFREKDVWYGVALEFNLVVDGDSSQVVFDALDQAVRNYFEAARKNRLDVSVLNQKPDAEYERMWNSLENVAHPKKNSPRIPGNLYSSMVLRPAMA